MLVVLSPAKKLATQSPEVKRTDMLFPTRTASLATQLRMMSPSDIATLMGLSENLSRLNFERYQLFDLKGSTKQPSHPAIFLFQGDVYQYLKAETFTKTDLSYAQQHLAILSGLYGLLRPSDQIQPYRLEMGTQLANEFGQDLYHCWRQPITDYLNKTLCKQTEPVLLNLASNEYAKAVDTHGLSPRMVSVHFKQRRADTLKTIGLLAKRARGDMARTIIKQRIDNLDELKDYQGLGYRYQPKLSDDSQLTFVSDEQ